MKISDTLNNLTSVQKGLVATITVLVVYFASAAASYGIFYKVAPPEKEFASTNVPALAGTEGEDPKAPKTAECPIDGSKHTEKAKSVWEKRRPLAVMIENHEEARPQSGLSSANVVYETVAEGGITRFMALFYCNMNEVQVGPVRSARTYFLDWLGEYDGLYAHVGGANTPGPADALGQIIKYGVKDLNQFSIGFPVFWRDYQRLGHPVATEHTMYSTTAKLWEIGAKRGWTNVDEDGTSWDKSFKQWKFKDDSAATTGVVSTISVNFWNNQPNYTVEWSYLPATNTYGRKHNNQPHNDLNTNKQIEVKNIVVQFQTENNAHDGYENDLHQIFGTTGSGKALIIQDGKVTTGKWAKATRLARSIYTDSSGKEVSFNRGEIWIQTVPEGAKVTY